MIGKTWTPHANAKAATTESEHEEVRLVTEDAAALHSNGNAFAGSTEFKHTDGRLFVEAAATAAAHHLGTNMNAAATDSEHDEVRIVVEAAAALLLIGNAFAESTEYDHAD